MQELTITILENKKMTYPSNIVLVEGENLTTQVTVSAPSWEGLSIGCLITTPAGVMVDEFSADSPFLLTNAMLDRRGYIRFEFVGYKITEDSKEEVTRTSHAVELPVRSARPRLGEISPEPLPDLILQVTNAKNTALTAAQQADAARDSAAEIDAQARAAEAARVEAEAVRAAFYDGFNEGLSSKVNASDVEIGKSFYPSTGDTLNIKKIHILPFDIQNTVEINRLKFEITLNAAAAIYEFAIYDANYSLVSRSGVKETFLGINDVSLTHEKLSVGRYYLAFECNSTAVRFKSSTTDKALSSDYAFPLPASLTNLYEEDTGIYFELYSYALPTPTGFTFTQDVTKRAFAKGASGAIYGWNITSGKIFKSTHLGVYTDLMPIPTGGFWSMVVDEASSTIYTITGLGDIYKSSGLTSTDTFTNITDTAYKRSVAQSLPYSIAFWQGYLWYGEYSASPNELEGGPKIIRYNPATGEWKLSKQFNNCRHVHAFTVVSATVMYVAMGDATWGDNIGYHRILSTGLSEAGDTWTKWTKASGENSLLYPVDSTTATINGIVCLLGAADQPGSLLSSAKLSDTSSGNVNISPQCLSFSDSASNETVRNVILDADYNAYFITTSSEKIRLCVSPPPYTQAHVLREFPANQMVTSKMIAGSYIYMYDFVFHVVSFGTVAKTINSRRYIYNNKEIDPLTYITSGAQGSNGSKNAKDLYLEATSNLVATQITSYYTASQINTTGYKKLVVEGEYFDSFGDAKAILGIATDSNPAESVSSVASGSSAYTQGGFYLSLDLTSYQGPYNIHVKASATGLAAQSKLKIKRLYLSKNI